MTTPSTHRGMARALLQQGRNRILRTAVSFPTADILGEPGKPVSEPPRQP